MKTLLIVLFLFSSNNSLSLFPEDSDLSDYKVSPEINCRKAIIFFQLFII